MLADPPDSTREALLDFWFKPESRRRWFDGTIGFDIEVRRRCLELHEAAARGELDGWREGPRGCLALVVLLDQVPRNVFRGTARAFATDHAARAVAAHAIAQGFDTQLNDQAERMMLYLPFEHSEDLADQERCVELMASLDEEPAWYEYARAHRDVIARFGRFPSRNAALERESTPDEDVFLAERGSGW